MTLLAVLIGAIPLALVVLGAGLSENAADTSVSGTQAALLLGAPLAILAGGVARSLWKARLAPVLLGCLMAWVAAVVLATLL